MKWLNIIGLGLSFGGSIMMGLMAHKGIPRKGELIKAPSFKASAGGWVLIALGFLVSLVATRPSARSFETTTIGEIGLYRHMIERV